MSSKSDLSSHFARHLKIRCLNRIHPAAKCYGWSLSILNTYVNFELDNEEPGLFDCFEIEVLRQRLIENWQS
jgi:hypothetical protein